MRRIMALMHVLGAHRAAAASSRTGKKRTKQWNNKRLSQTPETWALRVCARRGRMTKREPMLCTLERVWWKAQRGREKTAKRKRAAERAAERGRKRQPARKNEMHGANEPPSRVYSYIHRRRGINSNSATAPTALCASDAFSSPWIRVFICCFTISFCARSRTKIYNHHKNGRKKYGNQNFVRTFFLSSPIINQNKCTYNKHPNCARRLLLLSVYKCVLWINVSSEHFSYSVPFCVRFQFSPFLFSLSFRLLPQFDLVLYSLNGINGVR